MTYSVTDNIGRSYFEGREFPSQEEAEEFGHSIAADDRPFGVWIVSDDLSVQYEIAPAAQSETEN